MKSHYPEMRFEDLHKLFSEHFVMPVGFERIMKARTEYERFEFKVGMNFDDIYYKYLNCSFFCKLGEFKQYADPTTNFVYDRQMGIVFVDLSPASHSRMMAALYCFHMFREGKMDLTKIPDPTDRDFPYCFYDGHYENHQDISAQYLDEDRGFYLSSAASKVMKSKTMKLTGQEKAVFSAYVFRDFE